MDIPFTQFLRPDGARRYGLFDRPEKVALRAMEIIKAGYSLTCEELRTGEVSIAIGDDEGDSASRLVPNGPELLEAIDEMILSFEIPEGVTARGGTERCMCARVEPAEQKGDEK